MKKIFINKESNMVEQILEVKSHDELPDDYFSSCYAVIDEEGVVNGYNVKYDKELKQFEVIEGMPAIDYPEVIPSDVENLKKENAELIERVTKLENALTGSLQIQERGE